VLKPVEEASNALSKSQISALIPYVRGLHDELNNFETNLPSIEKMKTVMVAELKRRFWHFKENK
jgi:hypothetical protein